MTRRLGAAGLLVAFAAVLAGCGSDSDTPAAAQERSEEHEAEEGGERAGTPQTVDCPADATAVDAPADFAAPLPEGAVVVAVDERDGGETVVTAVVPRAEPDVLAELQDAYSAAGLELTEGETEERDAESNFEGDGVVGRWGIRALSDCSPEATRMDVVVRAD